MAKDILFVAMVLLFLWYKSPPRTKWLTWAKVMATIMIVMMTLYDARYLPVQVLPLQEAYRQAFPVLIMLALAIMIFGIAKDAMEFDAIEDDNTT